MLKVQSAFIHSLIIENHCEQTERDKTRGPLRLKERKRGKGFQFDTVSLFLVPLSLLEEKICLFIRHRWRFRDWKKTKNEEKGQEENRVKMLMTSQLQFFFSQHKTLTVCLTDALYTTWNYQGGWRKRRKRKKWKVCVCNFHPVSLDSCLLPWFSTSFMQRMKECTLFRKEEKEDNKSRKKGGHELSTSLSRPFHSSYTCHDHTVVAVVITEKISKSSSNLAIIHHQRLNTHKQRRDTRESSCRKRMKKHVRWGSYKEENG